jgi:4-diphosphocytidyl-2-C-methyl-D-erythritol kinase
VGGGSTNAGQVIRYVARRDGLDLETAVGIARAVGSDVPFFLCDGPTLVSGTGETLTPVTVGPGLGVLCLPDVFVNTGAAYQELKRTLQETPPPKSLSSLSDEVRRALERSDWAEARALGNDFEEPVFGRHPELAALTAAFIREGAAYASLSGSGSALYALVSSKEDQSNLLRSMRSAFPDLPFHAFEFPATEARTG